MNENEIIGKTTKDAIHLIRSSGHDVRVISIEGIEQITECDYSEDRYNLTIEDGVVSKITRG